MSGQIITDEKGRNQVAANLYLIGDPTAADSILDRLIHNAYRIELKGESLRKKRRKPGEEELQ